MTVQLIDSMGSDLSVVNAARVSFAKESDWERTTNTDQFSGVVYDEYLNEKDQKLITYLALHNHWSPFAHSFLSFRIKAPIFVARQLVKHQVGLAWNEVSRRYVDDEPEFWFPDVWRGKPVNAKQGSSDEVINKDEVNQALEWYGYGGDFYNLCNCSLMSYQQLIDIGVAPEQARMILPQNTMTEWIWSGSLMAFARVCKLRLDPHAQKETQEVAQQINDCVPDNFLYSWKALLA